MISHEVHRSWLRFGMLASMLLLLMNVISQSYLHSNTNRLNTYSLNPYPKLLLNSGLTESREAEMKVILWFEGNKEDSEFVKASALGLPQEGWTWDTMTQVTTNSKKALTLSGYRLINSEEEAEVIRWFGPFSERIRELGGVAYLDERIQSGLDIGEYYIQNRFEPKQWAISGSTASIAGYHKGFFPEIQAGGDVVNIQLLTRRTSLGEKTVLAIPALLEEF